MKKLLFLPLWMGLVWFAAGCGNEPAADPAAPVLDSADLVDPDSEREALSEMEETGGI